MRVKVKWTTQVQYERTVTINDDDLVDYAGTVEQYLQDHSDEFDSVLADLEDDHSDDELAAEVMGRAVDQAVRA